MARLSKVTEDFSLLESMKELALRLARDIDKCKDPRDIATLSRQYRETMKTIDDIEGGADLDDDVTAIIIRNRQPASD